MPLPSGFLSNTFLFHLELLRPSKSPGYKTTVDLMMLYNFIFSDMYYTKIHTQRTLESHRFIKKGILMLQTSKLVKTIIMSSSYTKELVTNQLKPVVKLQSSELSEDSLSYSLLGPSPIPTHLVGLKGARDCILTYFGDADTAGSGTPL